MRMTRRRFFNIVPLAMAGGTLTACGWYYGRQSAGMKTPMECNGTFQRRFAAVEGVQMHSLVSQRPVRADAPAVVFVHGSGLSGRYMIPTAREMAADFIVHVPDLPGFGDSGKPQKVLDVPELADSVAGWMSAVGLQRASLLGNSFGCQVIADLAARYPERVEKAILQGPTTPPEERSWLWQFIRWRQNQKYNPASLGDVTNDDYRKCGFRRMYYSFQHQLTDRIEDKAPRIQAPLLVVRGEHDPIANQAWCEQIARLCPRGRLALIPDVAHTLCYTAPVQLAEVSRSFLNLKEETTESA